MPRSGGCLWLRHSSAVLVEVRNVEAHKAVFDKTIWVKKWTRYSWFKYCCEECGRHLTLSHIQVKELKFCDWECAGKYAKNHPDEIELVEKLKEGCYMDGCETRPDATRCK